jgi:hypothetical protein
MSYAFMRAISPKNVKRIPEKENVKEFVPTDW